MTELLAPRTTLECSLSAAETLLQWHLDQTGAGVPVSDPSWLRAAVLLAATWYTVAQEQGLLGQQVKQVRLTAVREAVQHYPASALESCPDYDSDAYRGTRTELLAAYGTGVFNDTQRRVDRVLQHHLDDAGDPDATLRARSEAFARAEHVRSLARLHGMSEEDY
jgi:hypothetical protein